MSWMRPRRFLLSDSPTVVATHNPDLQHQRLSMNQIKLQNGAAHFDDFVIVVPHECVDVGNRRHIQSDGR